MAKKPIRFSVNPLLSGPSLEARNKSGSPYRELELSEIDVDPEQPRQEFDQEKLAELAASIKEHGLINPILVRVLPGGSYRLIAGERRFRAFKLLGKKTIPVIVDQEEEGKEVLSKQLVENLQRADLNPVERSEAICRLRDEFGISVRDLAQRLGISKSAVQRSLDIRNLPKDLIDALRRGVSESKVLLISQVEDPKVRAQLLEKIDSLTREGLGEEMREKGGVSHGGTAKKVPPADARVVSQLQQNLGLKVQILRSAKKKEQGKLSIEFYSDSDLEGIVTKLLAELR